MLSIIPELGKESVQWMHYSVDCILDKRNNLTILANFVKIYI